MTRTGKYYAEGDARAKRVEDLFSRIAPRYDLINDLQSFGLHRYWKRRLVRLAEVPEGGRALDLCCGTGDLVLSLARVYHDAACVVGLDFSMPMLAVAAGRTAGSEPRIAYARGDALRIPAADGTFERISIAYGLRNVADIGVCLSEARRVLRPGGRLLILDFGKPRNAVLARLYFGYLRRAVPLFGRLFFGDPDLYGYILESLEHFPGRAELAQMLTAAGFASVRTESPLLGAMSVHVADVPPGAGRTSSRSSAPACGT